MSKTRQSKWLLLSISLGASALGTAGCAGVFGGSSEVPATPAQLAQRADDSCTGISEPIRQAGLLAYKDAFSGATPLQVDTWRGKAHFQETRGAVIAVRATPNMTAPWLGRVNDCHAALVEAGLIERSSSDPFVVPGATTAVSEVYAGYSLTIRAPGGDPSGEVLHRAQVAVVDAGRGPAMAQATTP